jgi:quercetin dioxygenase-like cupin family protein
MGDRAPKIVQLFGVRFTYQIESADSGGALAMLEVEIPPQTLIKPHTHTREDEYSIVLEGNVGVRLGDRFLDATAGDYLVKPRNVPHAMWNASTARARIVEVLSPGGLEMYFEELAPILQRHDPPDRYDALAARYGLTINDEWVEELETTYGVRL